MQTDLNRSKDFNMFTSQYFNICKSSDHLYVQMIRNNSQQDQSLHNSRFVQFVCRWASPVSPPKDDIKVARSSTCFDSRE